MCVLCRRMVDDAGTHHGYEQYRSILTVVGGSAMREGKIRMMSIGESVEDRDMS